MISKNKVKFIKSLQIKKFRIEYKQFLVEGAKSVLELIHSDFILHSLFITEKFYGEHSGILKSLKIQPEIVTEAELEQISSFSTNNAALAIAGMRENLPLQAPDDGYALILDDVRDPGNLGTIIRIADWYGISRIICSETTADWYNPKVISASMGSFTRVKGYYCNLENFLTTNSKPVYAAMLEGKDVHNFTFARCGYIMMGNESDGIGEKNSRFITEKINIPSYGKAESLNVSIATAVICDNMRRLKI